jgi:hypothetical protein
MFDLLKPVLWVALLVLVALAGGVLLEHGGDVLQRWAWGAPAFPVIDGETQYPAWFRCHKSPTEQRR